MITLRPASANDVPLLIRLNKPVQDWHARHYPDRFRPAPDQMAVAAFFQDMLATDNTYLDLSHWEDEPVGYCFSRMEERGGSPLTYPGRHLHIEHLAVLPTHRRRGIASAHLQHCEERARKLKCDKMNLTSWAENSAAHATFENAGLTRKRHWFEKSL